MEIPFPVLSCLIVGMVLALSIPGGNRSLGILASSVLTYFYPGPMLAVVLAGVGIYFWKKVYSK
jgi:hypothetical protein